MLYICMYYYGIFLYCHTYICDDLNNSIYIYNYNSSKFINFPKQRKFNMLKSNKKYVQHSFRAQGNCDASQFPCAGKL